MIWGAVISFEESMLFPGFSALLPCLGSALVILADENADERSLTSMGRILSLRPMVYVGLISYSLYLFHWPLIVFAKHLFGGVLEWKVALVLVPIMIIVATLSLHWIERPIRDRRWFATRRSILGLAIASIAGGGVVGAALWKVVPGRYLRI